MHKRCIIGIDYIIRHGYRRGLLKWAISLRKCLLLRIVFLNPCIHTGPPYAIRGGWGGLALHRPRKEKNGYNSTTTVMSKTLQTAILKLWQKVEKSNISDLVKSKNPYIVFIYYKWQKLVMYVGAKSAPHIH